MEKRNSIDDASPEEWSRASAIVYDRGFTSGTPKEWDEVNKPLHYNTGKIECIDAIEAMLSPEEFIGYLRGNSLKYRWRMRYKGKPLQDMEKAKWYENRLMVFMSEKRDALGS
jgi:hypothetical protein